MTSRGQCNAIQKEGLAVEWEKAMTDFLDEFNQVAFLTGSSIYLTIYWVNN